MMSNKHMLNMYITVNVLKLNNTYITKDAIGHKNLEKISMILTIKPCNMSTNRKLKYSQNYRMMRSLCAAAHMTYLTMRF